MHIKILNFLKKIIHLLNFISNAKVCVDGTSIHFIHIYIYYIKAF